MRNEEREKFFIQPDWPAPASVKAFTTLRESGIGDRCSPDEVINYGRLKSLLALPNEPVWLTQKHTATVIEALPQLERPVADAAYTDKPNQVCAILTADCLPVLMSHRDGTHVAAIHAGWRGLANGIIEETLKGLTLPPKDILVWLGPAIGPERFEVRKDVYDIFTKADSESKVAFTQFAEAHWRADLYHLARIRLQKQGVRDIFGGGFCTHSDQKNYFSYRRDGISTGRIVSLIWIEDSGGKV
jgi:YfiH family protein